jgi:hypothetical protein
MYHQTPDSRGGGTGEIGVEVGEGGGGDRAVSGQAALLVL